MGYLIRGSAALRPAGVELGAERGCDGEQIR